MLKLDTGSPVSSRRPITLILTFRAPELFLIHIHFLFLEKELFKDSFSCPYSSADSYPLFCCHFVGGVIFTEDVFCLDFRLFFFFPHS